MKSSVKLPDANIKSIQFVILNEKTILSNSVCEVTRPTNRNPRDTAGTPYDEKMGIIERGRNCLTCNGTMHTCPGHFGHIILPQAIIHPKAAKTITQILKCICPTCYQLRISEENLREVGLFSLKRENRLKALTTRCEKVKNCEICKGEALPKFFYKGEEIEFFYGKKKDNCVKATPDYIRAIFLNISDHNYEIMGFNEGLGMIPEFKRDLFKTRPEDLTPKVLPVIPPCCRPWAKSDISDDDRADDDITEKYNSIVKEITKFKSISTERSKVKESDIPNIIRNITMHISTLIDNTKEKSKTTSGKPHSGINDRWKDKSGRFRNNLMGKRVDYTARTVIDSGAGLSADSVGIPWDIAKKITTNLVVNRYNYDECMDLVNNTSEVEIIKRARGKNIQVDVLRGKQEILLEQGDILKRYLRNDGDYVIFNRQPTLRKESMMSFKTHIIPNKKVKSFLMTLSAAAAYNFDFDGDRLLSTGGLKRVKPPSKFLTPTFN